MYLFKKFILVASYMLSTINLQAQMELDSFGFLMNDRSVNSNTRAFELANELALWRKADSNSPYPQVLIETGDALYEQGGFKEARDRYKKALLYSWISRKASLPLLYGKIALTYQHDGQYTPAIRYYVEAFKILKGDDKQSAITRAKIYTNIAGIFTDIPNYEKAGFYLDKALPVFVQYKDSVNAVVNLSQRAYMYRQKKQYDSALALYTTLFAITEQAIQNKKEGFNLKMKTMLARNIADLYGIKNDPDAALKTLDKVKNDLPYLNAYQKANIMYAYANTYLLKSDYDLAESYFRKVRYIFEKENSEAWLKFIYKDMGKLYELKKDYKSAWYFNKQYADLEIENFRAGLKELNNIYDLESKYQLSQQENELIKKQLLIARQEKNILKKNTFIAVILSGSAILLFMFFFLYRSYRRKQRLLSQEKEIEQLKAMMKGEENERIRLARELHDGIGGMLAAIKMNAGAIKVEHPETAHIERFNTVINMLHDTSAEVRTTAHNLMPDTLTKYGLQEALSHYISKMNASHNIVMGLHIPDVLPSLDKPTELIIYRIIQELMQNVIKHARASRAEIQIIEHKNNISITVEDNGIGFDTDESTGGFGLENLRYRVNALNGELDIQSAKGSSTTVRIVFNLEKLKLVS